MCTGMKYELLDVVYDSVTNAMYMSMAKWKKMIKCVVLGKYNRDLCRSTHLYDSLSYTMSNTMNNKLMSWWIYVNRCPWDTKKVSIIIRLLLNTYRLGVNMCM